MEPGDKDKRIEIEKEEQEIIDSIKFCMSRFEQISQIRLIDIKVPQVYTAIMDNIFRISLFMKFLENKGLGDEAVEYLKDKREFIAKIVNGEEKPKIKPVNMREFREFKKNEGINE